MTVNGDMSLVLGKRPSAPAADGVQEELAAADASAPSVHLRLGEAGPVAAAGTEAAPPAVEPSAPVSLRLGDVDRDGGRDPVPSPEPPVPEPPQDWAFSVKGWSAPEAEAPAEPAQAGRTPVPPAAPQPSVPSEAPAASNARSNAGDGAHKAPARLGDKLVDMGLISRDQLQVALLEKRNSSSMLGEILVDLGFITEQALAAVLAESSGFARFQPGEQLVDTELLKKLPKETAQRYRVFPVSVADSRTGGGKVRVAMADVYDVIALDLLKHHFGADTEIEPLVCGESDIQKAIDQYYGHELSIDGILRELEQAGTASEEEAVLQDDGGYTHPIVRLVDAILLDCVKQKASDVHFEPEGNFLRVRYRIDGEMMQVRTIHKAHWPAFSHRLKLMAGMNIADKLNPQDGRIGMTLGNQKIDFRVSSLPTVHGENLVLRILDKSSAIVPIESLGYSAENFALLTRMVKRPEGIIIVTGPTGSGKTTTLYAVMTYINSLNLNIMTLEDPVEYELSLIRQSQVREGTQLSFAEGIRTLLRQDPDVILVGEVRDSDTARMALRAAMTGHQVYTTLHTNDAAGAIPRLIDLGMRPSLMSGNIIGIVAQRLARKLCVECKRPRPATAEECRVLGADAAEPPTIYEAVGCPACRHTGYKGRIAIAEILPFNETIDEMIIRDEPLSAIKREAANHGFVPMQEDGLRKVLDGVLSLDSLMRVVDLTDRL